MSQDNKIDLWLKRVGYISQIGTLIVMIITIFYTVIPLYRTAFLEESIAKKENELKNLANRIRDYETKERQLLIDDYVRTVSFSCTSISKPILVSLPPESIDDLYKEELTLLNENIEGCLKKTEYIDKVMDKLSDKDKTVFKSELDFFVNNISELRREKIQEYHSIKKQLENNELIIDINDDLYPGKILDAFVESGWASEESIDKAKKRSYLKRLEWRLEDDIRKKIYQFDISNWAQDVKD
ncbi:hypothetical protein AB6H97_002673 [Providencia rettgeri]